MLPLDVEPGNAQGVAARAPADRVATGATTDCVLVSEGKSFVMTATVESVDDDTANFNLELTGEL